MATDIGNIPPTAAGSSISSGSNSITVDASRTTVVGPLAIDATTSLTAVGLQVTGDPNTGVGAIGGADTLSIVTGGTERVRVDSTGAVGVGIQTSLLGFVHVKNVITNLETIFAESTQNAAQGYASLFLRASGSRDLTIRAYSLTATSTTFGITNAGLAAIAWNNGNAMALGTLDATPLIIGTNNAERARFDSAGLLGIGATPIAAVRVSITDAGTANDCLRLKATSASGSAVFAIHASAGQALQIHADGGSVGSTLFGVTRAAAVFVRLNSTGSALVIGTDSTSDLVFGVNSAEAYRVDNSTKQLKFASTSITANGSGAVTAPGSIGPSAISVQEWLTVKNASGTTRYVPLYG